MEECGRRDSVSLYGEGWGGPRGQVPGLYCQLLPAGPVEPGGEGRKCLSDVERICKGRPDWHQSRLPSSLCRQDDRVQVEAAQQVGLRSIQGVPLARGGGIQGVWTGLLPQELRGQEQAD